MPEQRTLIFGFFLIALAAIIWWFQQGPEEEIAEKGGKQTVPDYIITGFEVAVMDEHGKPSRHLKAKTMLHFESEDRTELTHPEMVVYEQDRVRWKLQAQRGVITSHQEVIELLDECTLDQHNGPGDEPLHLRTRDLRIDTNKRYAETSQHVEIESGANRLSGTGMQLWFKSPVRLKLLSEVRSHYEIQ